MKKKIFIFSFVVLIALVGIYYEGMPDEHSMIPGKCAEASGCFCLLRMKDFMISESGDLILKLKGKTYTFQPDE